MRIQLPKQLLLPALLIGCLLAHGQETTLRALDSFSGAFLKNIRAGAGERAYLTANKSIYTSGEAVWFRTFLLNEVSQRVSVQSKYLFVDLVNEGDIVIKRSLLDVRSQQTAGRLQLPDSLATGYYWLRAYTTLMAEGDSTKAAVVPLYVVNPTNPILPAGERKTNSRAGDQPVTVAIFPEGGSLITGANTTLGIFVHDAAGRPLALGGSIKDNRDSVVGTFNSSNNGLAKTTFFPYFYRKYRAVVSYQDKEYSFPLPPFNGFAGQLSASMENANTLKLRTVLEDSIYRPDALTYVLAISRDSLCFASIGKGSYELSVPLTNFPSGIATFLLFDKNFRLLSQRSVYVPLNQVTVTAQLDKEEPAKRTRVSLTTTVLNSNNQPVQTSLAIAVSDSNAIVRNEPQAIADLIRDAEHGAINNWNILHLNGLSNEERDVLMMCRPTSLDDAAEPVAAVAEPQAPDLFDIRGRVLNTKGQPMANKNVTLISRSDKDIYATVSTDTSGKFVFPLSGYMDSTQFLIQLADGKTNPEKEFVRVERADLPQLHTPAFLKRKLDIPASAKTIYARHYADTTNAGNGGWLRPVSVVSRTYYDHSRRISTSTSVLTSEQLMRLGMGNIGIGVLRMPGATIVNGYLSFYGPDQIKGGANANSEPIILLDGNQIGGLPSSGGAFSSPVINYLNTLNPREIDFIEVIKGPEASIYGVEGGSGVIYIHSASGVHEDFVEGQGNAYKFYRAGFARPALFPVVNYTQKDKEVLVPDTRSAIYWNENELADNKGNATFTFYTNDIPGWYEVVITGLTVHGDLIYKTFSFRNK